MTGGDILVVKVGGSLMEKVSSVIATLKAAASSPDCAFEKIILVPGGGIFADEVRKMNADDETSHWMAILAMEKFGYMISALGIPAVDGFEDCLSGANGASCANSINSINSANAAKLLLLLPYRFMREYDPLPHSWDITSDSIAAWAAAALSERIAGGEPRVSLLLLKSVDGIRFRSHETSRGAHVSNAAENSETNPRIIPEIREIREGETFEEVDPFLIPLILKSGLDGYILNAAKPQVLTDFICGRNFSGTRIHRYP